MPAAAHGIFWEAGNCIFDDIFDGKQLPVESCSAQTAEHNIPKKGSLFITISLLVFLCFYALAAHISLSPGTNYVHNCFGFNNATTLYPARLFSEQMEFF